MCPGVWGLRYGGKITRKSEACSQNGKKNVIIYEIIFSFFLLLLLLRVRATYDSRLYCHFEAISPFGGEFAYFLRRSYHENSLSIQVLVWLTN